VTTPPETVYSAEQKRKNLIERARASSKKSRQKHKERRAADLKSWQQANPEKCYANTKKWSSKNPDKVRVNRRRADLMRKFGITIEQYDSLLLGQGNKCAICKTSELGPSGRRFHVDHDHSTGKNRGILCHFCNVMLGCAKDNTQLLEVAIKYLRAHGQT